MTYENFLKIILNLQKQDTINSNLYKNGIDLFDFVDMYHGIINSLLIEIYGKEGNDWFSWFCYENNFGQGELTANDENGDPICYSHESLWEFLEKNYKINR
jgi:hypothetical protein